MTRLILLLNFAIIPFFTFSQSFWGLQNSQSSGIFGLELQPASTVGQSPNVDIKLGGISAQFHNNFIGIRTTSLYDQSFLNANENNYRMIFPATFNGKAKSFYLNTDLDLPGISIKLSPKTSISLTGRMRNFFNLDGVQEPAARFAYESLNTPDQFGTTFNNRNLRIGLLSYAEFAVGFGQEVYNESGHVFKIGGRVKLLAGLASAYLYTRDLEYSFNNDHVINIDTVDIAYRHGTTLDQIDPNFNLRTDWGGIRFENIGFGLDLGGVYEYHPDEDGYAFKLGVSVLDIGAIKFNQSTYSQNFAGSVTGFDFNTLQGNSIDDFDSTLNAQFTFSSNTDKFQVALPSAISIQADIRVTKRFYVGVIPFISIGPRKKPNRVHHMTGLYLSPRLEGKGWGVGVPISYVVNRGPAMGLTMSAGPFMVGTTNLLTPIIGEKLNSVDVHLGFRAPIGIKKKVDTDNDGVPDKKDDCPEVPGLAYLNGCPEMEKLNLKSKKNKTDEIIDSVPEKEKVEPENSEEDERRLNELMEHEKQLKEAAQREAANKAIPSLKQEIDYEPISSIAKLESEEFEMVHFETAKASLSGGTRYSLNRVYEYLRNHPATGLKILGHADTVGPEDYNETLSRRRSEAVKNYFIGRGIAIERLVIEYLGESAPLEKETSEEARKRNRRVELRLIKL